MATRTLDRQLSELEAARYRFGRGDDIHVHVLKLLTALDAARFTDSASLIRFHEALMFVRAFPQSAAVLRAAERILNNFHTKVEALVEAGADMDAFDTFEVGGIAGTTMEDTLSFDVARWLARRMPGAVEIAWDNYQPGRELGTTGPRLMPLLEDDAFVEADTPWRQWLEAAAGADGKHSRDRAATADWLIGRFERLALPEREKAELYESLRIPLRWKLGNARLSRTRNWSAARKVFYHEGPLMSRSEVSLGEELAKRPPTFERLSLREGERIADFIREVMLVRYRELYGTTLADPRSVVRADVGRGVAIYLWNLPPERRLPLRAYVAGFTLKNGVPINYIEAIGLCEWMEVGFNTFYTFRGGEAGWIYAQVLRCLCSWMGTTVVSVYPYQLGHDNEEAIESGAFWFYRKLGFRPGRADLLKLVESEEKKIAADRRYRTSARTLRRLAAGHVFYELPGAEVGAWDKFSTRNIGLHVNRRMAREFGGDAETMRAHVRRELERGLGARIEGGGNSGRSWSEMERKAFDNFALALGARDVQGWPEEDKSRLVRIIRAKAGADEMLYLHLTQRHARLREALLRAGRGR
jgi:hypothetical protein